MSKTPWTDSHRYALGYDDMDEDIDGGFVPVEISRAIERELNRKGGAHVGFSGAVAEWVRRYESLKADYSKAVHERSELRRENEKLCARVRELEGLSPKQGGSVTYYTYDAGPLTKIGGTS